MSKVSIKQFVNLFFLISSISIYNIYSVTAQKLDWYIEPVITDAQTIMIIYDDHKFVIVKDENELYGIKNYENKLIVPIEYKGISILRSEKVIRASKKYSGGVTHFYDFEGNKVEDMPKHLAESILSEQSFHDTKEKLESYFRKFPNIKFELADKNIKKHWPNKIAYNAIDSQGDTIMKNIKYDPNRKAYLKEIGTNYLYRMGKVFDYDGNLVFDFGASNPIRVLNNDWISNFKEGTYYLYDDNFNLRVKDTMRIRRVIDSAYYLTDENKNGKTQFYLKKLNGEKLDLMPFESIYKIKGTNCYALEQREEERFAQIYNSKSDQAFHLKYRHGYRGLTSKKEDILQEVYSEGKFGVVNMVSGELFFDIEYGYVEVYDNYIVTGPIGSYSDKHAFNMYSIYDKKGKLLKEVLATRPEIYDQYILIKTQEDCSLYDGSFNVIKELDVNKDYFLSYRTRSLMLRSGNKNERRIYFIKDIIEGKDDQYSRIEKFEYNWVEKNTLNMVPVRDVNNFVGALDLSGNETIPFVLDEIISTYRENQELLIVKKDGKIGVLRYP